jgi:hypothetical protein
MKNILWRDHDQTGIHIFQFCFSLPLKPLHKPPLNKVLTNNTGEMKNSLILIGTTFLSTSQHVSGIENVNNILMTAAVTEQ